MSWWDATRNILPWSFEILAGKPGGCVPCNNPQTAIVVPQPDPVPDLSTKPKDIIGYCFGYVCPKKHVNSTFGNITVEGYKERRVCQTCGAISKPATVKKTAEAQWENQPLLDAYHGGPPNYYHYWAWSQTSGGYGRTPRVTRWTKYEFVHYLDTPRRGK